MRNAWLDRRFLDLPDEQLVQSWNESCELRIESVDFQLPRNSWKRLLSRKEATSRGYDAALLRYERDIHVFLFAGRALTEKLH